MARPDPALLDAARYPFTCAIPPRFGDMDLNRHINNVAMCSMVEDSRVRFHYSTGYRSAMAGTSTMIASFSIEYLGEAHYPDSLDFAIGIEKVGRTSHTLAQLVSQNGKPVAFARSVLVAVDDKGPVALPETFTAAVERWMLPA